MEFAKAPSPANNSDGDTERACWICLSGSGDGELVNPCACPKDRVCHTKCLARWQLQSAGKSEEHHCRFCMAPYPSWKDSLTPAHIKPAIPVVSVHYAGNCFRLRVRPGPEGFANFQRQLCRITGLPALDNMQITFQCRAPDSAQELCFNGFSAFDAAIHCAAISAAERAAIYSGARGEEGTDGASSLQSASRRPSVGGSQPFPPASTNAWQSALLTEPVLAYRHATDGSHGIVYSSRSRPAAEVASASGPRLSVDSRMLPRVDSQVLLHDREPAAEPGHNGRHKHARRLRRFRQFLRNLFA